VLLIKESLVLRAFISNLHPAGFFFERFIINLLPIFAFRSIILGENYMDTSFDLPRDFLPVHPELKIYEVQEFYSVPKPYLVFLEQDMQTYGDLILHLRTIHCNSAELYSVLLRMGTRIDNVWNHYLTYLRGGAASNRINQFRECNRKLWYAANMLCIFLTSSRTLSNPVFTRRMEYILEDMEDLSNSMKGDSSLSFDEWQPRFIVKIHGII
jgi:hypothetical protein